MRPVRQCSSHDPPGPARKARRHRRSAGASRTRPHLGSGRDRKDDRRTAGSATSGGHAGRPRRSTRVMGGLGSSWPASNKRTLADRALGAPRPWRRRTAAGAAALLGAVAILQVVAVLGAPVGRFTQGGRQVGVLGPAGRVLAAVSAVLLVLMSVVIVGRVGTGGGGPVAGTPPDPGLACRGHHRDLHPGHEPREQIDRRTGDVHSRHGPDPAVHRRVGAHPLAPGAHPEDRDDSLTATALESRRRGRHAKDLRSYGWPTPGCT